MCSVQDEILKWPKSDEFLEWRGGGGDALYWILLQNTDFFYSKILNSLQKIMAGL